MSGTQDIAGDTMVATTSTGTKTFSGAAFFRHRIVLATLASTTIRIKDIRSDDATSPGLSPSEVSFIRLIDKITSGAVIQINDTGTTLFYKPGTLIGGDRLIHDCHTSRGISYYLEPLIMVAPFCKYAMSITLRGSTHAEPDVCGDNIAQVTIPLIRRLTTSASLSPAVEVRRRALASVVNGEPAGKNGEMTFRCDVLTGKIPAVDLIDAGVIKRVRGVAFGNRVSPGHISRLVDSVRGIFNRFSPDVYVHTDHGNNRDCGTGFGISLVAESTEGSLLGGDWSCARPDVGVENVANAASSLLLEEIENGGCVDSNNLCTALLFCALSDGDLSRIRIGKLTEAAIWFLRDLETFFGVRFHMRVLGGSVPEEKDGQPVQSDESDPDEDDSAGADDDVGKRYGIVMSCIGIGLVNRARQRF